MRNNKKLLLTLVGVGAFSLGAASCGGSTPTPVTTKQTVDTVYAEDNPYNYKVAYEVKDVALDATKYTEVYCQGRISGDSDVAVLRYTQKTDVVGATLYTFVGLDTTTNKEVFRFESTETTRYTQFSCSHGDGYFSVHETVIDKDSTTTEVKMFVRKGDTVEQILPNLKKSNIYFYASSGILYVTELSGKVSYYVYDSTTKTFTDATASDLFKRGMQKYGDYQLIAYNVGSKAYYQVYYNSKVVYSFELGGIDADPVSLSADTMVFQTVNVLPSDSTDYDFIMTKSGTTYKCKLITKVVTFNKESATEKEVTFPYYIYESDNNLNYSTPIYKDGVTQLSVYTADNKIADMNNTKYIYVNKNLDVIIDANKGQLLENISYQVSSNTYLVQLGSGSLGVIDNEFNITSIIPNMGVTADYFIDDSKVYNYALDVLCEYSGTCTYSKNVNGLPIFKANSEEKANTYYVYDTAKKVMRVIHDDMNINTIQRQGNIITFEYTADKAGSVKVGALDLNGNQLTGFQDLDNIDTAGSYLFKLTDNSAEEGKQVSYKLIVPTASKKF